MKRDPKKPIRHHFIPQFYLEAFADPSNPPYLWQYDKEGQDGGDIKPVPPRHAGLQKHFHTFTKTDGTKDTNSIESALCEVEGQAAPLLKKLSARQTLDNAERSIVSFFLALSMVRVPNFRKNLEYMSQELVKKSGMIAASSPGFFEQVRALGEEKGHAVPENVEELENMIRRGTFKVDVHPESTLEALTYPRRFAPLIHEMNWCTYAAGGQYRYVTSDNPFSYMDPTHDPNSFYGVGLLNKNVEVTFPLSPDVALVARWTGAEGHARVTDQVVKRINLRTISSALRFVYASENSAGLHKLVLAHKGSAPTVKVS